MPKHTRLSLTIPAAMAWQLVSRNPSQVASLKSGQSRLPLALRLLAAQCTGAHMRILVFLHRMAAAQWEERQFSRYHRDKYLLLGNLVLLPLEFPIFHRVALHWLVILHKQWEGLRRFFNPESVSPLLGISRDSEDNPRITTHRVNTFEQSFQCQANRRHLLSPINSCPPTVQCRHMRRRVYQPRPSNIGERYRPRPGAPKPLEFQYLGQDTLPISNMQRFHHLSSRGPATSKHTSGRLPWLVLSLIPIQTQHRSAVNSLQVGNSRIPSGA